MSLTLYRIEGMFPLYRIGACFRKPDSGHADTISLTIRVRRASQKRHETQDPVRSNAVNVRFHGVRRRPAGAELHDQQKPSGIASQQYERGIYAPPTRYGRCHSDGSPLRSRVRVRGRCPSESLA